jgi:glycosyltransferase involved in cell wall biosynthesis
MALVSVVIAVYNDEAFVAKALDSALAQRFPDFEVIVVDDGSTDSTGSILRGYGNRIRVLRQANQGCGPARNRAAAISSSKYLAFLDADDWWREDRLSLTVDALEKNPAAILAFSGYHQVAADESPIGDWSCERAPSFEDMFTRRIDILPSTVLIRRSGYDRCGGFCEEFRGLGFEDTYMWLLAREQGEFAYVNELLTFRRMRPSYCQKSWFVNAKKFERRVLARYGTRALPIVRQNSRDLASVALNEFESQLRSRNPATAVRWLIQAARLRPSESLWRLAAVTKRLAARKRDA